MAVADAYGMGFEYVPQEIVETENNLKTYRVHGLYNELAPGQYTDDTQMSIALYEHLLEQFRYIESTREIPETVEKSCNQEKIADMFLSVFKRDQRKGYSKGFQTVLEEVSSGKELIERIEANGKTTSNGAAMRAIPAGIMVEEERFVIALAEAQGTITHQGTGILAAKAVALAANYLWFKRGAIHYLPEFINDFIPFGDASWDGSRVSSKEDLGLKTAKAAIHTLMTTTSYAECLQKSISYGGDTDSVAAIACGLCAISPIHEQAIPEELLNGFERGPYGLGFLYNMV